MVSAEKNLLSEKENWHGIGIEKSNSAKLI